MMKNTNKTVALGTLGVFALTAFGGAMQPAEAAAKGKRNLAIGLGAVTAYGLVKKNKTVAIVGGVGTALAYRSYKKSAKKEEQRRIQWYKQRYGSNWRARYNRGT